MSLADTEETGRAARLGRRTGSELAGGKGSPFTSMCLGENVMLFSIALEICVR